LRLRLWVSERLRPGEAYVTLFWAGLIGAVGGMSAPAFRAATQLVQWALTGRTDSLVETARALPDWQRICVPAAGGLLAGLVLHFGSRLSRGKKSVDYMEAVTLGDGVIKSRPSLVRIASSMFSIGSGGSIGREGPMVQLAAMTASLIGRFASFPRPRLRLMVACGAAAGIASAYNAPVGGALFVAEIVLGTIAMESFGPLVFASVMSTIVARMFLGGHPLFTVPRFSLVTYFEIFPYIFLGLVCGVLSPWFRRMLSESARIMGALPAPIFVRMLLGGLVVGLLSVVVPDVWGNGYNALGSILTSEVVWRGLLLLFVFKLVATAATVGSGAVGGVFTPTLLVGAILGALIGQGVHQTWPELSAAPQAYALVGMGAFLAATTHAPLMAILILFEMTLDYDIVLPLMLACVTAYTASRAISPDSLYSSFVKRGTAGPAALDTLRVADLMKTNPVSVLENARFEDIVAKFLGNRHHNLYVVGADHQFRGVIPLHDIKPYLNDPTLAQVAIAHDLLHDDIPTVTPETSLRETLDKFATHPFERIPVVDSTTTRRLIASISKTDLLLALGGSSPDARAISALDPRAS
jgi:CIC family chloride channel protein